jgi:hypothetical protein
MEGMHNIEHVTILPNFPIVIEISLVATEYTASEDEGEVEVCSEISDGSLERTVIVDFSTVPQTAQGINLI